LHARQRDTAIVRSYPASAGASFATGEADPEVLSISM